MKFNRFFSIGSGKKKEKPIPPKKVNVKSKPKKQSISRTDHLEKILSKNIEFIIKRDRLKDYPNGEIKKVNKNNFITKINDFYYMFNIKDKKVFTGNIFGDLKIRTDKVGKFIELELTDLKKMRKKTNSREPIHSEEYRNLIYFINGIHFRQFKGDMKYYLKSEFETRPNEKIIFTNMDSERLKQLSLEDWKLK